MAGSRPPVQLVHGESTQLRPTRVLLGWLSDQEAPQLLYGRASVNEAEAQKAAERVAGARANVQKRQVCTAEDPVVASRPSDVRDLLESVARRADVQGVF